MLLCTSATYVLTSHEAQFLRIRNLVRRYHGKYSLERSRQYEENLTLDLRENGCGGVKRLKLAYSCVE